MVSHSFQNVLATAGACASKLGHSEVTVTHVTYVLCTTGALNAVFQKLGMDAKAFEDTILDGLASSKCFEVGVGIDLKASQALAACISRAEGAARTAGRAEFSSDDFLVEALEHDHNSPSDDFARSTFYSLNGRQDLIPQVKASSTGSAAAGGVAADMEQFSSVGASEAPASLALWAVDLVESAARGELDEVFGRDVEIGRVCNVLRRRRKNNPVLIGEPGVGKTAVIEGLAVMIARGTAPDFLAGKRIYALDLGRILAGTRNRGDLEERFKAVLDTAAANPDIILFIDEIHTLMSSSGAMAGIPDLLKPALAAGRLRCIGATTFDEFSRYIGADPAMVRRFQEVAVHEPERDEAVDIIRKAAEVYAGHHEVTYPDEAIVAAVDLSIRYLVGRQLPDKAIDILDEAAAKTRARGLREVTHEAIVEVVREMSRDPFIGVKDEAFWEGLSHRMGTEVQGRDGIVNAVSGFLRGVSSHPVARSGAKASFLLQGPEGSGKRHLAETLAGVLGIPFLPLDMSSYGERNSLSGLIGAPPGYVGYDDGGKLTEFARRHPVCVILFDKINRASEPVRDIVSKAISEGQILDSRGRKVNFRNAIIIVSQDAESASRSIGFRTGGAVADPVQGISGMSFDRMFAFDLLSSEAATKMVGRRFELVSESYSAAGNRMTVVPSSVEVVTARGREGGGRACDYMSAFAEMFEAELFRKTISKNGALRVSGVDDRVVVDLEDAGAIAA
jgi:ATP-dependent Clp protease ATP-binding subunit ClpA